MSSLAGMFKERGFQVTGSDLILYPPADKLLARMGIRVFEGYRAENLDPPPDLVIIGNAISRGNPEAEAVLDCGIPYLSFPQALAQFFMADKYRIVIAGTHGKSTSSAMLAWVLTAGSRDPSFMVGAAARDFGSNFRLGAGREFVVEGDEYDTAFFDKGPKFLHYDPHLLVLTAIEFDHADIYRDLDQVKNAFRELLRRMEDGRPVLASADFPCVSEVTAGRPGVQSFGLSEQSSWRAANITDDGSRAHFAVVEPDGNRVPVSVKLAGRINVANALGVYAAARTLGLEAEQVARALGEFSGLERRQQVVARGAGILLIDDFAHHPTAVAGTIAAMRSRYPGRRLWALFEPRSNTSRRGIFQEQFADALAGADRVIVGAVYHKTKLPGQASLSTDRLSSALSCRGVSAEAIDSAAEIAARVAGQARDGDVIVIMSNGAFDGLRDKLINCMGLRRSD